MGRKVRVSRESEALQDSTGLRVRKGRLALREIRESLVTALKQRPLRKDHLVCYLVPTQPIL
jgi:hypothetical protein